VPDAFGLNVDFAKLVVGPSTPPLQKTQGWPTLSLLCLLQNSLFEGGPSAIVNNYNLHSLGWHSFQQLCLTLSRQILGQTVESFLNSKDGGRDGAFAGTWVIKKGESLSGKFVIQCKFTGKADKSLKLSDVADEVEKAKKLVKKKLCDSYLLLTNFNISGVLHEELSETFCAVGVRQFRCFGADWINQQIRERKRLRLFVPRIYGLGDLSQILDGRALSQARALLDSMREDLSRVVLTGVYDKAVRALESHGFVLLLGEPASGKTTIAAIHGCHRSMECTTVRLNVEENQLVNVFGEFGICLGGLKSA
jgi:hypothetical protein